MMQFVVFAAFAMVLSVREAGPPWAIITSPAWIWTVTCGYVFLAGVLGALGNRLVKAKLESEPAWLQTAQRRQARWNVILRAFLLAGFGALVFLTGWVRLVRYWQPIYPIWGLDEILILSPFFAAVVVAWVMMYPADRAVRQVGLELRLWASVPARPVWGLRAYLSFLLRQNVLIIAVPMIPIVVANDFTSRHADAIRKLAFGVLWADQAALAVVAGMVFLVAPVMLRYIWHTRVLPPGELHDRLDDLCRRVGLGYRRILIWESDGMVVNAAVMGLFRQVRYILLSDGLLEMMDDQKIEAVFGHEVGHIKHRHIQYYLLFAIVSMLAVGGMWELAMRAIQRWPEIRAQVPDLLDYVQAGVIGLVVIIWAVGFGAISRRFEWQADLFGARCATLPPEQCDQPCFVHGTAINPGLDDPASPRALCATAAARFADALYRIAVLNGIPIDARSWRHSSIANRMALLKQYGHDPGAVTNLERSVLAIKTSLVACTIIGVAIAVWLYWPVTTH